MVRFAVRVGGRTGVVSYEDLVTARPELLEHAAESWDGLRLRFSQQVDLYRHDVHDRVHDGVSWTGSAAEAARQRMSVTGRRLLATEEYLRAQASLLREAATGIRDCQQQVAAAAEVAHGHGVLVDASGGVRVPAPGNQHNAALNQDAAAEFQRQRQVAVEVEQRIRDAVAQAAAWDAEIARRLRMPELFDAAAEGGDWWSPATGVAARDAGVLSGFDAARVPPVGSDPAVVREFWERLSQDERDRLIHERPELIGALDGIRCRDRDAANRILLRAEIARTEREIAQLVPPGGYTASGRYPMRSPEAIAWKEKMTALQDRLGGLNAIEDRLYQRNADPADPRHALLLGLDTTGTGRAIVSVGDPDTARNVVTYVPGTGAHLGNIGGDIDRSDRIVDAADRAAGFSETASVTWVGYTAPQGLTEAPQAHYATDAEPLLQRFEVGLRTTHEGVPAHQTILGHSYGSTTVGYAMRDGGLPVDAVMFVGSPGVGVEHASDLGIDPARVYAGTSANDPIQFAASLDPARIEQDNSSMQPGLFDSSGPPDKHLWFGRSPTNPNFGGSILPTDPGRSLWDGGSHSQYWDQPSTSWKAIGRVAVGLTP